MRKIVRKQLEDLLTSMQEMHKAVISTEAPESRRMFLGECQQAASTVGTAVEKEVPDDQEIVSQLEHYCEEVFMISEEEWEVKERLVLLDVLVDQVRELIRNLPVTYHVVFMPYKAEMWDSLESIWKACKEDIRCDCYVMPLPYYEYNANRTKWELCYDGGQFPNDVPVVNYKEYALEKIRPEIAYIHNPYDDSNLVTRIHPSYYSQELKKYVGKLVYVPYYVTSGFFVKTDLPAYHHMDYIILQSKAAKESCRKLYFYNKILPLGSPKIDKIIQTCKDGVEIPTEWKPMLEDRKVLMLNTSIVCFLSDGDYMLKKIRYICDVFSRQDKVALIWRPHPLLEATIKSMRPHLLSEYRELVKYFRNNRIGVLDRSTDIEKTVALSDGYIGEESTSVINLFEVAGKPSFILNNYSIGDFTEEEKKRVFIYDMVKEERFWVAAGLYNALLWMDESTKQFHLVGRAEGQPKWQGAYPALTATKDTLFLAPYMASCPVAYHINEHEFEPLLSEQAINMFYRKIVTYRDRVFYLPALYGPMMEYNTRTKRWKLHFECIQELRRDADVTGQGITFDCAVSGDNLWITASYTNRIMQFCMNNGTYFLHAIGRDGYGYSGIAIDGDEIWLAEVHGGAVLQWNQSTQEFHTYQMPEEFCHWKNMSARELPHLYLIDMGNWIATIPGYANGMVKIDKSTGKTSMMVSDFWQNVAQRSDNYDPSIQTSGGFGKRMGDTSVMVQRHDGAAAIVNVEEETYEVFYPTLSEEDYSNLTSGEDGFEKIQKDSAFCRRENWIFSLEGFMDDLVQGRLEGVKERQMKELETMAANLDGTCGEKVHEFMMGVLERER